MINLRNVRMIGCKDRSIDLGRVYYVSKDGKRHYIPGPDVASSYGWKLKNIKWLPYSKLISYPLSYSVAKKYDRHAPLFFSNRSSNRIRHVSVWNRSYFGAKLKGTGLEFSAASNPWPFNLDCKVYYADPFDDDEGCKVLNEHKDFVPIDYKASLEDWSSIGNKSFDFICCSHVIEHTPLVLQALKNVYEHLKQGGTFLMAVPHMCYTFDQLRELTPLEHHIKDYKEYCFEDDIVHLVDYIENVTIRFSNEEANITESIKDFIYGKKMDFHHHTFTEESMSALLNWFNKNIYHWSKVEVYDHLEGSNEFFVRLIK